MQRFLSLQVSNFNFKQMTSFTKLPTYPFEFICFDKQRKTFISDEQGTVGSVRMEVQNILSKDDNILLTLKMKNKSSLNYEVELLKAYIRDSETNKRDLVQEVEVKPKYVYVLSESKTKKKIGEAKGEYRIVLLFNKFAIAKVWDVSQATID